MLFFDSLTRCHSQPKCVVGAKLLERSNSFPFRIATYQRILKRSHCLAGTTRSDGRLKSVGPRHILLLKLAIFFCTISPTKKQLEFPTPGNIIESSCGGSIISVNKHLCLSLRGRCVRKLLLLGIWIWSIYILEHNIFKFQFAEILNGASENGNVFPSPQGRIC